uniref:S100 calcium binding protein A1 n=1 Tax=Eptatretus burgeri TaxID=7764 RepID=A0A8C4QAC2_EPTBU
MTQSAMQSMVSVFHKYSGREGDKYKLSKRELIQLLTSELPAVISSARDAAAVNKIMKELDDDRDGEVDFNGYSMFIASLSVACNDVFLKNLSKSGKM